MDRWYLLEVSKYSNSLVFLALHQVSQYASKKKREVHDFLRTPKTLNVQWVCDILSRRKYRQLIMLESYKVTPFLAILILVTPFLTILIIVSGGDSTNYDFTKDNYFAELLLKKFIKVERDCI